MKLRRVCVKRCMSKLSRIILVWQNASQNSKARQRNSYKIMRRRSVIALKISFMIEMHFRARWKPIRTQSRVLSWTPSPTSCSKTQIQALVSSNNKLIGAVLWLIRPAVTTQEARGGARTAHEVKLLMISSLRSRRKLWRYTRTSGCLLRLRQAVYLCAALSKCKLSKDDSRQ